MGIDALQVAEHVEMQRAGLDTLHAPGADTTATPDYELFETVTLTKRRR